jgi:hypothetical protein
MLHVLLAASIDAVDAPGPRIALATSVAAPWGAVDEGTRVRDSFTTQLVLDASVAYRMVPTFQVGIYSIIGAGAIVRDREAECRRAGSSCDGSTFRVGARAEFHPTPTSYASPWLALGAGYENAKIAGERDELTFKLSVRGIEGSAAIGCDLRVWDVARVGPFVWASIGRYLAGDLATPLEREGRRIEERQIHGWISVGLRMVLAPVRPSQ